MAMMKNFDKDFVKRTIKIIDMYYADTEFEVTLLLNCLLGMLTLPIERKNKKKSQTEIKFQEDCVDKLIELCNQHKYINIRNEKKYIFKNIRNAIAHLHIELEEDPFGNIENVILKNALNEIEFKKKNYNLQINISVMNLKEFAKYVANEYLIRFFE